MVKTTKNALTLKQAKALGNIPCNVGFDPKIGYEFYCPACDSKRYLLGLGGKEYKKRPKPPLCHACGCKTKLRGKLDPARSYHLTDISYRAGGVDEKAINRF